MLWILISLLLLTWPIFSLEHGKVAYVKEFLDNLRKMHPQRDENQNFGFCVKGLSNG